MRQLGLLYSRKTTEGKTSETRHQEPYYYYYYYY